MNAGVKSRQFCSVCKEWLEMDIVPTSDGDDDDGVIWYRCPQCQGFLPKLKNAPDTDAPEEEPTAPVADSAVQDSTDDEAMEYDSPSAMMEAEKKQAMAGESAPAADDTGYGILPEDDDSDATDESDEPDEKAKPDKKAEPETKEVAEPIQEYAAMLADVDPTIATPYRPWADYEVGQCIHHLAWDDCGVVVAKETLPGNRSIIKVYFETAGVIRLIEKAPR